MKTSVHALLASVLLFFSAAGLGDISIDTTIVIKPGNPDKATEILVKQAEQLNGYFVKKGSTEVVVKVPSPSSHALQKFVEDQFHLLDQRYTAANITGEIMLVQSQLTAKETLLGEYQQVLVQAAGNKIVTVSAAIAHLIEEIERLRSRIVLLRHRTQYATFTFQFQLDHDRLTTRNVTSSFSWLNEIGLSRLITDFSK